MSLVKPSKPWLHASGDKELRQPPIAWTDRPGEKLGSREGKKEEEDKGGGEGRREEKHDLVYKS
jgi:hypothetical protein